MADEAAQITSLFSKLQKHIKNGSNKKILKTTDEILSLLPGDGDALHARTVALMELADWPAALSCASSSEPLAYETAYCLYRLERYEDCLAALARAPQLRARARDHLSAQALLRLGRNDEAAAAYDRLANGKGSAGDAELATNAVAALVAASRGAEAPALEARLRVAPADAFELAYNGACAALQAALEDAGEGDGEGMEVERGEDEEGDDDDEEDEEEEEEEGNDGKTSLLSSRRPSSPWSASPCLLSTAAARAIRSRLRLAESAALAALEGESPAAMAAELAPLRGQRGVVAALSGGPGAGLGALARARAALPGSGPLQCGLALAWSQAALRAARDDKAARRAAHEALRALEPWVAKGLPGSGSLSLDAAVAARLGAAAQVGFLQTLAAAAALAGRADLVRGALGALGKVSELGPEKGVERGALAAAVEGDALKALDGLRPADAADAARLALLKAQVAASRGKRGAAAAALRDGLAGSPALQHAPAVVATRVALAREGKGAATAGQKGALSADDGLACEAAAARAAAFWQAQAPSARRSAALGVLGAEAVNAELSAGRAAEATRLAGQLDPAALAGAGGGALLQKAAWLAALRGDAALRRRVAECAAEPAGPSDWAEARELDALETKVLGWARLGRERGLAQGEALCEKELGEEGAAAAPGAASAQKRKRRRKLRLPKGFDPEKPGPPPNPERWLPKWQRQGAKKLRRRRREQDAVRGSQGAGKVDAALDRTDAAPLPEGQGAAARRFEGKGGGRRRGGRR